MVATFGQGHALISNTNKMTLRRIIQATLDFTTSCHLLVFLNLAKTATLRTAILTHTQI